MKSEEKTLSEEIIALGYAGRRIAVVTDTHVAAIHAEGLLQELRQHFDTVLLITLEAGESHKNLATVQQIYEALLQGHFDRRDLLIAFGGGVVGDITGFAAATYLRGIAYLQVPTTLLAMCDSSIGGKTGVDFSSYKNMVGAFYLPKLIFRRPEFLKTLPERELRSGLAEVVKYGLICDAAFFVRVREALRGRDFLTLLKEDDETAASIIEDSCRYKTEIVEEDPTETGKRAILNFGHTIGHAIETLSGFTLLHGECVAIGSIAAAHISMQRELLQVQDYERICSAFADMDLPVTLTGPADRYTRQEILRVMRSDKKADGDAIRFILLKGIGQAVIERDVTEEEIDAALKVIGVGV